jgi:Lrp/AsnC family transcriptional regulator for asnA, asnC and gidA
MGQPKVDDIDRRIMAHLRENSRKPYKVIARDVGLSETAVRHRIARMLRERVFTLTIFTDPAALGLVTADVYVRVGGGRLRVAAAQIASLREVEFLAACSGSHNLTASVVCASQDHLVDTVEKIGALEGVEATDLEVHLCTLKSSMEWLGEQYSSDAAREAESP